MASDAGLDARLLVRTDDVILATQRLTFPGAIVQIEDPSRFLGESRIAREDPVLITPRLDRVSVENSPDRAGTDGSADRSRGSSSEIRGGQPTQRKLGLADSLTSNSFNDCLISRGKTGLSPASRLIGQGAVALGPAVTPEACRVGIQFDDGPSRDIGQRW